MRDRFRRVMGGKRRRRTLLATMAAGAALVALLAANALAVHDLDFQLDGDVKQSTPNAAAQTADWDSLFDVSAAGTVTEKSSLPDGFNNTSFDKDFSSTERRGQTVFDTSDQDIFATGSKDTLPIAGWQCKKTNNVTDKNDIMNAYSTSYRSETGDKILYFALEKNANEGSNNVGFWFLGQDNVNCDGSEGTANFSGEHRDGDLLIVSEFDSGGRVSTIKAYPWKDPNPNDANPGSLDVSNPVTGGDCDDTSGPDNLCATTNKTSDGSGGTIDTPWPTANKDDGVQKKLRTGELFEGGLNATQSGFGDKCFNTFLANTRASTSPGSDLEDFSRGRLGECSSTTTTTPKKSDGTNITSAPIPATGTLDVKDSAEIKVDGADTFSGNVKFYLCRSSELDPNGTPLDETDDTCKTGGTQIGTAKAVTDATSPHTVASDTAKLTVADRYCWRAEFTATTEGLPNSSDSSSGECFDVTPLTPQLSTQANGPAVTFGTKIYDTVFLSGTANKPGSDGAGPGGTIGTPDNEVTRGAAANGTIAVKAFGPDDTLCAGTAAHTGSLTVSGDRTGQETPTPLFYGGAGSATEFQPSAPGVYRFVASYNGDGPNTLSAPATSCGDTNEHVTVAQIPTQISTAQKVYPNDSATITSSAAGNSLPTGGTVVFRLYGPTGGDTPKTAEQNCLTRDSGGLLYEETKTSVGGQHSVDVGTTNGEDPDTRRAVDADGTYYWRVTYNPGATSHTGRQSDCAEHTVLDFTNDSGPGTAFSP